jgi:Flp pilus assembly protein TadG
MRLRRQPPTRGSAVVETAMVLPALIAMLFAIMETGMLVNSVAIVRNAAREACRAGAVGQSTTQITSHVTTVCTRLSGTPTVTSEYRTFSTGSGTWSGWSTLTNATVSGTVQNAAPTGAQIRVTVAYTHHLITNLLSKGVGGRTTVPVTAAIIMRRE